MVIGAGHLDRTLSWDEIRQIVAAAADELQIDGRRLLVIIPDGTRTMPMRLLFEIMQQEVASRATACDYIIALGTHPLMRDAQLTALIGRPVINGTCGSSRVMNHRWDLPETFAELGIIPRVEVARISAGLLDEAIPVRINRMALDYDRVLICGPVFPHEVVGFSGGNKYLFPGIAGPEMIDQTHWLGALLGSYELIGTPVTPVREMINTAAAMLKTSVACLSLVVTKAGVAAAYFGAATESWKAAADISSQVHIEWVTQPYRKVLAVMPNLYDDLWTAAKGMYKVEPALADGGEVVIYAPHITEVSYTHGAHIERIGYHCRDYFLQQWERFKNVPRGVLAHSTHLRGQGSYDAQIGVETPRVQVTLATGIPEEKCRKLNLGYLDPATVRPDEWHGREAEGIKMIPRAGETLYRLKKPLAPND